MSYCKDCIHYKVCGNEGVDDSAMTFCADKQTNGDLISRQAVIQALKDNVVEIGGEEYSGMGVCEEEIESIVNGVPSAEKTDNKININEYVKVKLTDYGKEIFYHQYDNLNKAYGKEIIKPSYPTVDSDGYTSFQLWCFMNLYGRYIDMGVQNVIEPLEIVFESADNTAEWIIKDGIFGIAYCSKCDYELHMDDTNYCPNYGRRMKGVGE